MCSSMPFSEAVRILSTPSNKVCDVTAPTTSSNGSANVISPMSIQKAYCSDKLEELDNSESDTASEAAESEEEMDTFEAPVVSGLKMMGLVEKMDLCNEKPATKKKWGPMIAPRPSTRVHSRQNIMETAGAYKMKKNLKIPATFKSKSFTTESLSNLEAYASAVNIMIGDNEKERTQLIKDIIRDETEKCLVFASQNPEISLIWTLKVMRMLEFVLQKMTFLTPTHQRALLVL